MTVVACGPFTGDWEHEILNFRPFVYWMSKSIKPDVIYLSTHSNRDFLYEWIEDKNIIPVYEDLTRNELKQKGNVNDDLTPKDYSLMVKIFKEQVSELSSTSKREITVVTPPYTKTNGWFPLYNKAFHPIKTPNIKIKKHKIVFIPEENESEKRIEQLYTLLKKTYDDVVVIGDLRTYIPEENVVLKRPDYFENGYRYILRYIMEADAVVCPVGHWTALCNIQRVPVFSWGDCVGQYKEEGVYNFGNKKGLSVFADEDTPTQIIFKLAQYFIERRLT